MDQNQTEQEASEAVRWHARLRAHDCGPEERRAFQSWLTRSAGHARAFERVQQASMRIDQLARHDPRMRELAAAALGERAPPQRTTWRAAAAVMLGIGLAAALVLQKGGWFAGAPQAHYANNSLQQQTVELADGSRVHLDVGAQLDVRLGKSDRTVDLQSGRAYFEVAHDAARPFAVDAAGVRTVALGTRFQVNLDSQGLAVTLAEGSVAVSKQGPDGWEEILQPGQQLQLRPDGRVRKDVNAALEVGWSSGRLVFREALLTDVLEEINRYASVKLRLGDGSLGDLQVGGTFIAGADSVQVAAALTAALPLSAVRDGAHEIVLFKRYDTAD